MVPGGSEAQSLLESDMGPYKVMQSHAEDEEWKRPWVRRGK